jgi:hypothetical protein
MPKAKPEPGPVVFCPGCGKPLGDTSRLVHEGCPEDPRQWVSVPPPS